MFKVQLPHLLQIKTQLQLKFINKNRQLQQNNNSNSQKYPLFVAFIGKCFYRPVNILLKQQIQEYTKRLNKVQQLVSNKISTLVQMQLKHKL